ncbi:MAG: GntR family transcriptional regulator [Sphaerochaetaceae bacterium]
MDDIIFNTAGERAYNFILDKILNGDMKPGTKISLRKMATEIGTSTIPVIEAVKRLESDMLVQSKPKWGAYVSVPTYERIKKTYQVREAIECETARYLSTNLVSAQKDELYSLATLLDTTPYTPETIQESRNAHLRFHMLLTEYTGNEIMLEVLKRMNFYWILANALATNAHKVPYPRYWHRLLMDDICKGDPDLAEKSMRTHIHNAVLNIEQLHEQELL